MPYAVKKICADCRHVNVFPVTKVEAAFELYERLRLYETSCPECGSLKIYSTEHPALKLDQELLDLWGRRSDYRFSPQDEAIILAEIDHLPLILATLDVKKYPREKLNTLTESICIMLYDHTANAEEYTAAENAKRSIGAELVRPELLKRKPDVRRADALIRGYVKAVVYPQLGLALEEE